MPLQCEICGNPIYGELSVIKLDDALLRVCRSCAKLGTAAQLPREVKPPRMPIFKSYSPKEAEFELREDYSQIIKRTREKIGLSQEEFGHKIKEKPSVIRLLESGKLKPDDILAKKIEHALKIQLLVPIEEG